MCNALRPTIWESRNTITAIRRQPKTFAYASFRHTCISYANWLTWEGSLYCSVMYGALYLVRQALRMTSNIEGLCRLFHVCCLNWCVRVLACRKKSIGNGLLICRRRGSWVEGMRLLG